MMANRGEFDGEMLRASVIEKEAPNLIRIPTVLATVRFHVFSIKNKSYTGIDMLGETTGILRGIKIIEEMLKNKNPFVGNTPRSLFGMLLAGRLENVLLPTIAGEGAIKKLGAGWSKVKKLAPPAKILNVYTYLHKKNKDLVSIVNKSIAKFPPLKL